MLIHVTNRYVLAVDTQIAQISLELLPIAQQMNLPDNTMSLSVAILLL